LSASDGIADESCNSSEATIVGSYTNSGRNKLKCSVFVRASFQLKTNTNIVKELEESSTCLIPVDTTIELCFDFSSELPYLDENGRVRTDGKGWIFVESNENPVSFLCSPIEL